MALRSALISLLFLLAACDQSASAPQSPRLHIRQGVLCEIDRVGEGLSFRYRCTDATTLQTVLVEVRYASGAGEVWAVPHGGMVHHANRVALCKVYPAQLDVSCSEAMRLKENGDGSLQTTTGGLISRGRVTMAQGGGYASWWLE